MKADQIVAFRQHYAAIYMATNIEPLLRVSGVNAQGYHLAVVTGSTRRRLDRVPKVSSREGLFDVTCVAAETAVKPNLLTLNQHIS